MAGLRVIDGMKMFGLDAGIGITSGRVWCGVRKADGSFVYRNPGDGPTVWWGREPPSPAVHCAVGFDLQTVGNDLRKEYTALGDFVNLAARLMAKAGPREIYVDA